MKKGESMKQNVEVGAIEFCEAEMNVICPHCGCAFSVQVTFGNCKDICPECFTEYKVEIKAIELKLTQRSE